MGLGNNNGRFTYVNLKKGQLAVKKDNETLFIHLSKARLRVLKYVMRNTRVSSIKNYA